jgi:hypothetical protein
MRQKQLKQNQIEQLFVAAPSNGLHSYHKIRPVPVRAIGLRAYTVSTAMLLTVLWPVCKRQVSAGQPYRAVMLSMTHGKLPITDEKTMNSLRHQAQKSHDKSAK